MVFLSEVEESRAEKVVVFPRDPSTALRFAQHDGP
jgi:hypothetical protein